MKKRIIIAVIILVVICTAGTLIVLYNTPDIRIGMAHSDDGLRNIPMISQRCYLGSIGMSKKALEKWAEVLKEYNDKCGNDYAYIMTNYKNDLQLDTEITYEGRKTIIHIYGSGTPIDGESKEKIDKTYTINYKLKIEN